LANQGLLFIMRALHQSSGLDNFFDISAGPVPPDHLALVAPFRLAADKHPAVVAAAAAQPVLDLKRLVQLKGVRPGK
jgi:hypothetical protein